VATGKTFSKSFKIEAVRLPGPGEKPASQLARKLGIGRNQLYKWRDQIDGKGDAAFRGLEPFRVIWNRSVALQRPVRQESRTARCLRIGQAG
jgi:transposase-like protein